LRRLNNGEKNSRKKARIERGNGSTSGRKRAERTHKNPEEKKGLVKGCLFQGQRKKGKEENGGSWCTGKRRGEMNIKGIGQKRAWG